MLKFENVVDVLLDEDSKKRNSGSAESSGATLNTEERGRPAKRGIDRGSGRSQQGRAYQKAQI